ncbi:hypothetical protein HK102_006417 [Quaeritorhiza haematococci]|nr:hypothetical protein HK102_006417 [Quaeritorhiza haematococci]
MPKTINIDITSDIVCPWCFIGKKRLERAMSAFKAKGHDVEFKLRYSPYQLDPSLPKEGVDRIEHLGKKFGMNRVHQMISYVGGIAAEEGLHFSKGGDMANTLDGHRLLNYAYSKGVQWELAEELFKDHFERDNNIGDINVLAESAARVGLNKDEVISYLKSDEGVAVVKEEIQGARRKGVTGVPFFTINDKHTLGGAQDPEAFLEIFEQLL